MTNVTSEGVMQEVVLVTGGSGFLGQHIVRELQLHDPRVREIRVLDLQPYENRLGHTKSKPVRSFVADVSNLEDCREAFRGVQCVIHAAALVSYAYPPDTDKLTRVNVLGTQNVLQLCREEEVPRLVYISTAEVAMRPRFCAAIFPLVVGQNEIRALSPSSDDFRFPAYVFSKLAAEHLVIAADKTQILLDAATGEISQRCLRTVVLRPTPMYGELDPFWIPAALKAASWTCGYLVSPTSYDGFMSGRQQFTYAGNAAWATVLAKDVLGDSQHVDMAAGVPMFITDDTMVDHFFFLAQRILGSRARASSLWLPMLLSYPTARLLELAASALHRTLSVQPTALISFLGGVTVFSRLRANLHLLYTPRYSETEAIEATAKHFAAVNSVNNTAHED